MLVARALPMPFKKSTRFSVSSSVSLMMSIAEVAGAWAGIGCGFGSIRVVFATRGASPVGTGAAGAEVWVAAGVTGVPVACVVSVGL